MCGTAEDARPRARVARCREGAQRVPDLVLELEHALERGLVRVGGVHKPVDDLHVSTAARRAEHMVALAVLRKRASAQRRQPRRRSPGGLRRRRRRRRRRCATVRRPHLRVNLHLAALEHGLHVAGLRGDAGAQRRRVGVSCPQAILGHARHCNFCALSSGAGVGGVGGGCCGREARLSEERGLNQSLRVFGTRHGCVVRGGGAGAGSVLFSRFNSSGCS